MTHFTILATGSRGDVQPFVALAYALQQAGHAACVVTNAHFEAWVRSYGLAMRPIQWDAQASLQSKRGQEMVQSGGVVNGLRYALQESPRIFARVQGESWQACRDAERLIYSLLSPWGQPIAEKLGIPAWAGVLHPMIPTREFPTQLARRDLGPFNWASHRLGEWGFWLILRPSINRFRRELGLAPIPFARTIFDTIRQQGSPCLCSLSPTVIPRPADWPGNVHMAGYWFLPAPPGWQPSPELAAFLRAGPPPVYVGFGSMANQRPAEMTRRVVDALRQADQRGILSRGWGTLEAFPDVDESIFVFDEAPHEWLFPQVAAVVHHGGAGTTAAGFRAGVPQVIVPHMQDQPYWGQKVYELGVGPQPMPPRTLTVSAFAETLRTAVTASAIQTRAAELGEKIRREDGAARMVAVVAGQHAGQQDT